MAVAGLAGVGTVKAKKFPPLPTPTTLKCGDSWGKPIKRTAKIIIPSDTQQLIWDLNESLYTLKEDSVRIYVSYYGFNLLQAEGEKESNVYVQRSLAFLYFHGHRVIVGESLLGIDFLFIDERAIDASIESGHMGDVLDMGPGESNLGKPYIVSDDEYAMIIKRQRDMCARQWELEYHRQTIVGMFAPDIGSSMNSSDINSL